MKLKTWTGMLLATVISTAAFAQPEPASPAAPDQFPALTNTVILIIRHAEKPPSGYTLTPAGEARAKAYVNYFENLTLDGQPVKLDCLFAAADTKGSHRPRLTIEPTSKALGLPIDTRFNDKQFVELARELHSKPHGQCILIAWHHGEIPQLLHAIGANPNELLPNGEWPNNVFGWMIELRFDANGKLTESKRINEKLMSDD